MDKLQPLITHRFWIITGVALILVFVGWQVGTGSLSEQFEIKKTAIDGAYSGIPDGKTTPNDKWIGGLDKATKIEKKSLDKSAKTLWDDQQSLMVWPAGIRREMSQYPYRDKNISLLLARRYRTIYYSALTSLWESLEPFEIQRFVETGKGRIKAEQSVIPCISYGTWKDAPPGPVVMWDSIEDIWLLKCLFDAINEVNDGSRLISDAPIRVLESVVLQGGTGTELAGASAEGGSEMGNMEGMMGSGADYTGGGNDSVGAEGFGGGTAGGGSGGFGVDVDLAQDVGSAGQAAGGSGPGSMGPGCGGGGSASGSGGTGGCGEEEMDMMGRGGLGMAGNSGKRYVDDKEDLPFKTRAFKLQLVMHIDKVPYLLAALNNAEWPIRILRVHQQSRSQEFASAAAGSTGGMGGMMTGGDSYGGAASGGGYGGAASGGFGGAASGGFGGAASGGFGGAAGGGYGGAASGGFGGAAAGGFGGGGFGGGAGGGYPAGASGTGATANSVEKIKAKQEAEKAQQIYAAAMEDPYLADVVVTGLITIYQPPSRDLESGTDDGSAVGENGENQSSETETTPGATDATAPSVVVPENSGSGEPVPAETTSDPMNPDAVPVENESDSKGSGEAIPVPEGSEPDASEGF